MRIPYTDSMLLETNLEFEQQPIFFFLNYFSFEYTQKLSLNAWPFENTALISTYV